MVEELFLGGDFATTKSLLHVLLHFVVAWACNFDKGLLESVSGDGLSLGLGLAKVLNGSVSSPIL